MVNIAMVNCAKEKTVRNSNSKHLYVLLVQIYKQPFTYLIVYGLKTAEKFEKRQPIFFKHILCKKSLDCIEKSLDHQASPKITMRGTSVQKQKISLPTLATQRSGHE